MLVHSLFPGQYHYVQMQHKNLTSQGNFFVEACHWSISQYTQAHEKTSTLWLYFGCADQSSGACQFTVPTRLRTIDRVDCFTFASPKSAIFAVPFEVIRIFDDLQSRWITDGFRSWRYWRPRAMSSIIFNCIIKLDIVCARTGIHYVRLCTTRELERCERNQKDLRWRIVHWQSWQVFPSCSQEYWRQADRSIR